MEYISSDTNVWIDFLSIDKLELPFRLPYIYLMNKDAVDNEILVPKDLSPKLLALGLQTTELSEEEFYLASDYSDKYGRLSGYDCIALAIAKVRKITLLTGDKALRNAARLEAVNIIGTIGILDELFESKTINSCEYLECLTKLQDINGTIVRLPAEEIEKRIDDLTTTKEVLNGSD